MTGGNYTFFNQQELTSPLGGLRRVRWDGHRTRCGGGRERFLCFLWNSGGGTVVLEVVFGESSSGAAIVQDSFMGQGASEPCSVYIDWIGVTMFPSSRSHV